MGPNSALSHGSALPTIEVATKYMIRMMWKAQTEDYKAFVPNDQAVKEFVEHSDTFHKRTIWGTKCRSWFKGGILLRTSPLPPSPPRTLGPLLAAFPLLKFAGKKRRFPPSSSMYTANTYSHRQGRRPRPHSPRQQAAQHARRHQPALRRLGLDAADR